MSPRVSLIPSLLPLLLLLLTVQLPLCFAKNTFRFNSTAMAPADGFTCPLGGEWYVTTIVFSPSAIPSPQKTI